MEQTTHGFAFDFGKLAVLDEVVVYDKHEFTHSLAAFFFVMVLLV